MVLWILRYVPYILILIAGMVLLFRFYAGSNKVSDISLLDAVKRLFRGRIFLCILLSAVYFAGYSGIKYCYNSMYPSLFIRFNYEEAGKGKNPNGTRFNVSEILSDEVLDEVILRGGYSVDKDELKKCLSLDTNYDEVQISSTMSEADMSSLGIATEYKLVYSPSLKTIGISGKTLLSLIGDVYYEKFMKDKTENVSILDIDFSDYDSSDYHSISDYLKVKADNLKHFIDVYSYADSNYRGENGESFAALSGKIESFTTVELERLHSYVVENGLSRDADAYTNTVDYKNKLLKLDYDKDMAAYNVRLEVIDMYDHQMARIVLVPTQDEQLEYYMSRTKIGVDDYANQAQEYLEDAKKLKNEIDDNTYAKSKVTGEAVTAATAEAADALTLSNASGAAVTDSTADTAAADTKAAADVAVGAAATAETKAETATSMTNAAEAGTAAAGALSENVTDKETAYAEADAFAETLKEELVSLSEQCKAIVSSYNADKKNALIQTGLYERSFSSMINFKKSVILTAALCAILCASSVCSIMYSRGKSTKAVRVRSKR